MIKVLTLTILVFLTVGAAHAQKCEVFGISDSPQKLDCSLEGIQIDLRCNHGKYFLNSIPVKAAYHYEVEYGSVPLVFEASEMKLIVVIEPKADIMADLERKGRKTITGTCQ